MEVTAGEGMAMMIRVTPMTRGSSTGRSIRIHQVSSGRNSRRRKAEERTSRFRSRAETLPPVRFMPMISMDSGVVTSAR